MTRCQRLTWVENFQFVNFNSEDQPLSSERLVKADENTTNPLIDANAQIINHKITERLNLSNSTVHDYLKHTSLISSVNIRVPYVLTEIHLYRHVE